jgi:hypothetical protein
MPRPFHPSWLDYSNYTWRRVQAPHYAVFSNLLSLHPSAKQTSILKASWIISRECNLCSPAWILVTLLYTHERSRSAECKCYDTVNVCDRWFIISLLYYTLSIQIYSPDSLYGPVTCSGEGINEFSVSWDVGNMLNTNRGKNAWTLELPLAL